MAARQMPLLARTVQAFCGGCTCPTWRCNHEKCNEAFGRCLESGRSCSERLPGWGVLPTRTLHLDSPWACRGRHAYMRALHHGLQETLSLWLSSLQAQSSQHTAGSGDLVEPSFDGDYKHALLLQQAANVFDVPQVGRRSMRYQHLCPSGASAAAAYALADAAAPSEWLRAALSAALTIGFTEKLLCTHHVPLAAGASKRAK